MKNESITPAAAAPSFDEKTAQPVSPTRHEPTGRTFCFVQGEHLFSATRVFVATDKTAAEAASAAMAQLKPQTAKA